LYNVAPGMPFDMNYYSKFQQNSNNKLNLEDMTPTTIKERNGYLLSGYPMQGLPSYEFINFMTTAFYDSYAFDVGKSPFYSPISDLSSGQRTYEADMWWSIAYAAYNSAQNPYADIVDEAKTIYDAYVHNFLYWTAQQGQQPYSNAFPMADIQTFEALPSHIVIRFVFIAYLAKMLYNTILSSITDEQIRLYADACIAQATMTLPVYGFSIEDL
jgi:hypothetical protein